MRKLIVVLILACACASGEDFKTAGGVEYKNVKVSSVAPDGISIQTDSGIVRLPFKILSKEIREKYHYDEAVEAAFWEAQQARKRQADEARDAANSQDDAVARLWANRHSMKEVETDRLTFIGVPFCCTATADISEDYTFGYRNAEKTHYAFALQEGFNRCCAYMTRDAGKLVRGQIVKAGGPLRGDFLLVLKKERNDKSDYAAFEILDVRPPTQ